MSGETEGVPLAVEAAIVLTSVVGCFVLVFFTFILKIWECPTITMKTDSRNRDKPSNGSQEQDTRPPVVVLGLLDLEHFIVRRRGTIRRRRTTVVTIDRRGLVPVRRRSRRRRIPGPVSITISILRSAVVTIVRHGVHLVRVRRRRRILVVVVAARLGAILRAAHCCGCFKLQVCRRVRVSC